MEVDESLIRYGGVDEGCAQQCLDELMERECDALIVCRNSLVSEAIVYAHRHNIRLGQDIDLVSFVDYDSSLNQLYADQMDSIIQPVEALGTAAGEQILQRVEDPDAPVIEKVLTSAYRPYSPPGAWAPSQR